MKKVLMLIVAGLFFCLRTDCQAQSIENSIVELAKIYKQFHYKNAPPSEVYAKLKKLKTPQLSVTVEFMRQVITNKNDLTNRCYLTKPDALTLRYVYAIKGLSEKLSEEANNNTETAGQILQDAATSYEMLDAYYRMLFLSLYFKNQPFKLTKENFALDKYKLADETEKGIFVLQLMNVCNRALIAMSSGDMNLNFPDIIQKFPKVNGLDYYKYTDLNFADFDIMVGGQLKSYKSIYIDKYYNLLITHLDYLESKKAAGQKEELVLTSILNESSCYKYCKNQDALKDISAIAGK